MRFSASTFAAIAACVSRVAALASTDSISDADPAQSGYLPNHNMDPAVVDSAQFGQLWKIQNNFQELFYAKPLVYTPSAGGPQLLFTASSQNWIRTLDAKTGAPVNSRQVHTPFLQSDIGCTDIPNYIGIIGTPVIDPNTDTAYFFAKTYIPNYRTAGNTGTFNGVYYFHGVNVNTLQDLPGYPVLIDGSVADNDDRKYFVGGTILQRPSLVQVGNFVYGAFGGHCDLFNYTGLVIGVDIVQKKVVTNFVTEAGALVPQTNVWNQNGGGGQGGIWMSGMGMASDGNRFFWVSGNGQGHENNQSPASGSSGCKTLGEAAVAMAIGPDGKITVSDYFQPYDYQNLDGGDQDYGSGGMQLLDPTVFKGTGVSKMALTSGKNGKIYVMNANNLGGYRLGAGQQDQVIQTITTQKAIFGGGGSYPLEGGFIYYTPVGYPTYAYGLGFSSGGVPVFSQVGVTAETSAGRVGVGIPTITSFQGKPGTAILWMTDPDAGLRAWYAVPQNGILKTIKLPQVNGLNKFQRPVFGDTRLYVTDASGSLYCLGSPVNLPLNCTSPVNFGTVALGSSGNATVTCTAIIGITQIQGATVGDANFKVSNASLPQGRLAAGQVFSFPVTWDLTNTVVRNAPNASYGNTSPGVKSTALTLYTVNAVAGYSTIFPVSLTGMEVSQKAYLTTSPTTVDYGGIVILDPMNVPTNTAPFTIANAGLSPLTITGYAYTMDDINGGSVTFTNASNPGGIWDLGLGFTSTNLPAVGTVIQAGTSIAVQSSFNPVNGTGNYFSYFQVWSNGGSTNTILEGSASTAPIANFSISTSEGGWLPAGNLIMDFGKVAPGSTQSLQIRICNVGGSVLKISKSKPPNGIFHISDPAELHEEQEIAIGACAFGTVLMVTNTEEYNHADISYNNTWTLNTDDLTFGVHVVEIVGTVVSHKVGPVNATTNLPVYTYAGCYADTLAQGRLLPFNPYNGNNLTNDYCQRLCYAAGYTFAGTEYQTQCFCGNNWPPNAQLDTSDIYCTYACTGDANDRCGGVGGYLSVYYDGSKYDPSQNVGSGLPALINSTGNYNYAGCLSEVSGGRALSGAVPKTPSTGSTLETCRDSCQGYTYFGVEFANECYCANSITAGAVFQTSSDPSTSGCSMTCTGNNTEYCGGPNRLSVFQIDPTKPIPPGSTPSATPPTGGGGTPPPPPANGLVTQPTAYNGNYQFLGCYTEGTGGRALAAIQNPGNASLNTPDSCAALCKGYTYVGVEYGSECYCDLDFQNGATLASPGDCNMACSGNSSVVCGAGNRLSVYQRVANSTLPPPPPAPSTVPSFDVWTYEGCYTEGYNVRALSGGQPISGSKVTVPACGAACAAFNYFGVEYSGECFCGNTLNNGSTLIPGSKASVTGCSMTCAGDASTYCGGTAKLNLYMKNNTVVNVPSSAATSTTASASASGSVTVTVPTTSTSSAAPTPTGPQTVTNLAGYTYMGCWSETSNPRALSQLQNPIPGANVSVESCSVACAAYTYFGVEYAGECYCGNSIDPRSANMTGIDTGTVGCNMACKANASEYCGGGNRLNMYMKVGSSTTTTTTAAVPTTTTTPVLPVTTLTTTTDTPTTTTTTAASTPTGPQTVTNLAGYTYMGCWSETSNPRALSQLQNPIPGANVSVESCSVACAAYTYFGVEYAGECYCGNSIDPRSANMTGIDTGTVGCNMACKANASEYCGGGNRLNMYMKSSSAQAVVGSTTTTTTTTTTTAAAPTTATTTTPVTPTTTSTTTTDTPTTSTTTTAAPVVPTTTVAITITSTTTPTGPTTLYPTPSQTFSNGWAYAGCANDSSVRALNAATYSSSTNMTLENCQAFCSSSTRNYQLAGLENGGQCYCGNALLHNSTLGYTGCNKPCTGNNVEICGGSSRLSVFNLTTYVPTTTVQTVGSYTLLGCYKEATNARLLTGATYTNRTGMTVESCVAFCAGQQTTSPYAGVENGNQCFCGATLPTTATLAPSLASCSSLCSGNNQEFCGGPALLDVYKSS